MQDSGSQQSLSPIDRLFDFLATGFYSGKLPKAPGTWGTLVAFALAFSLQRLFPVTGLPVPSLLIACAFTVFAIFCAEYVLRRGIYGGAKDPQQITIDEFAGFFVSIIGAQGNLGAFLVALVLFRLFDISKPFPARRAEKLHGGYGVVLDDIVAGFFAFFFGHLLRTLLF